ncbi:phosphotransferase [Mesorhizobium argentiipisi]|uniref:Aminoglycoside phosphotransferase domain-containing protein n=1 Tax=Mesorhizobium argentiipisi TaxID=3015175 RepID=A0ABU8K7Q4_9HYPH
MADDLATVMTAGGRTKVYVIGDLPDAAEFVNRRLALEPYKTVDELAGPGARALLIQAGDLKTPHEEQKLAKRLAHNLITAAKSETLVVVLCNPGEEALVQHTLSSVASSLAQFARPTRETEPPSSVITQVVVRTRLALPMVAEEIARRDCGPAHNSALAISIQGGGVPDLDPEIELLFRRAFADFAKIEIKREDGGRSRIDGVWSVLPTLYDGSIRRPFAVKCGPAAGIGIAIYTHAEVADHVPFRGCAPLCPERCVRGSTRRFAVFRFIESATRLDTALLGRDATAAVTSIYTDLLAHLRSHAEPSSGSFETFLPQAGWEPRDFAKQLPITYGAVTADGHRVRQPEELRAKLYGLPPQSWPVVRAHGDLNIRNVFVYNGTSMPVLIDFTSDVRFPLSYDCARLDVGLGFDETFAGPNFLPAELLLSLYSGDLFSMNLGNRLGLSESARHRVAALEAVRMQALASAKLHNVDIRAEYNLAVCASILFYARMPDDLGKCAYRCASALVEEM